MTTNKNEQEQGELKEHGHKRESMGSLNDKSTEGVPDSNITEAHFRIQVNEFEDIRDRLLILKRRKNLSPLEVIKMLNLRTGFFRIFESVDRIELLESENLKLKMNIRRIYKEQLELKSYINKNGSVNIK